MNEKFFKQKAKEINEFYKNNKKRFDFIVKSIISELDEVVKDKDNLNVYEELGDLFADCFILSDLIGGENFDVSYFTNKSFEKIMNRHKEMFKLIPQNQKNELYKTVKEIEEIARLSEKLRKDKENEQRE